MLFDSDFKEQFQDIRCFDDSEVTGTLRDLYDSTRLDFVFSHLFPGEQIETTGLFRCKNIEEIQSWLITTLVPKLASTYSNLSIQGLDKLSSDRKYIFVSNHRDIAMDPLLVNIALDKCGHTTAHNAIGDNLLLSVTGTRMALLNKCFRVARSVRSPKAMLLALKKQAAYIRHVHSVFEHNVWIAQREGRALDGVDSTNPALIKMLLLGSDKSSQVETSNALNICPVTLSYEWDPCDMSKATRLIKDETLSTDEKLANDKLDILNGMLGYKGKITVRFGEPVCLATDPGIQQLPDTLAGAIDRQIRDNYALYPVNTLANKLVCNQFTLPASLSEQEISAADLLLQRLNADSFSDSLSQAQKNVVSAYAQPAIASSNK
ncbi:hypothetical protein A3742_12245 [Oleiphilus sp. HI0071]|uniref:hypothetical protein n=1 Tax=unclassified Oleiphilus TaxID=2631174 RepID=UPI0007C239E7|nr:MULTISPECIES: hypothetical protein [unclassified Oleiphilus]KZY74803.1 hypothetical protein A3737_00565 [Oleiphilus sp. HI0065]KZY80828.1 hypothetical protein A3742_12245 [Oleiphilus sp. HI0071]KZY91244.1 hypothetical protein A3744_05150 [Oleiphilus sp. HI0073]KZZ60286.1 hypothetical protein A3760_05275 [Oleiphilus sp. HI0122]KZZ82072.1 hypothetical protein A3767_06155 [Oleiphilus sp. HI0133]